MNRGKKIDVILFDDAAQRSIQIGMDSLVDHAELIAQLTTGFGVESKLLADLMALLQACRG